MHSASLGVPELVIVMIVGMYWAIPIAFAIWMMITLWKIRAGQQAVQTKLEAIERLIERS
jgi:hypothetical protein